MPTTIFSLPMTGDAGNWEDYTFRVVVPITGGSQDRVRVKFESAIADTGFNIDHASIGIWTGTAADTVATPVELLFSGASGFALFPANVMVSDWAFLQGFNAANELVVIYDLSAINGNPREAPLTGANTFIHAAADSYNSAITPAGSGVFGDSSFAVSLIETQADFAMASVGLTNVRSQVRMVGC